MDVLSIDGAEELFDYLESRADRLTVNMQPGKGKGLTLLRFCNDLIRRLSRVRETETRPKTQKYVGEF